MRSLIDKTVAGFGRLDAAVNCAGTEGTPGPVTEQTAEEIRRVRIDEFGGPEEVLRIEEVEVEEPGE